MTKKQFHYSIRLLIDPSKLTKGEFNTIENCSDYKTLNKPERGSLVLCSVKKHCTQYQLFRWLSQMTEQGHIEVQDLMVYNPNVSDHVVHYTCPYCFHRYHTTVICERTCNGCEKVFTPVFK